MSQAHCPGHTVIELCKLNIKATKKKPAARFQCPAAEASVQNTCDNNMNSAIC